MDVKAKYWYLKDFNFAKKIGMKKMMEMCRVLQMEYFNRGMKIEYDNLKSVIFLKKGTVKILDGTSNRVKYLVRRGNIFGRLDSTEDFGIFEEYAIALEDVIVCFIEIDMMEKLMLEHAALKNSVVKIQSFRIRKLERRLADLVNKDSTTRIKKFLISYVNENGEQKENTIETPNYLNHKDIAQLTNTSRQTVNNVLTQLRKTGEIEYNRKSISLKL